MKKPSERGTSARKSAGSPTAKPKKRRTSENSNAQDAKSSEAQSPIELLQPTAPSIAARLVSSGAAPEVSTVIYVHGIGNKPLASVLKCQWDQALFGAPMGDRSRLVYWVDRERYPAPEAATCADGDTVSGAASAATAGLALGVLAGNVADAEMRVVIEQMAATSQQREILLGIASHLHRQDDAPVDYHPGARVLPLPGFLRRRVTNLLTRLFLQDVYGFLFDDARRTAMEDALISRLRAGGGPFILVAHSLGSAIAYNVLRRLRPDQCHIRLLVTIGSPLGMAEVQDVMKTWVPGRRLAVPECVDRWINAADMLDIAAIDGTLGDDFAASDRGIGIEDHAGASINTDSPLHPHSATGYLRGAQVRDAVRQTVSNAFLQLVGKTIVMRDLTDQIENGSHDARHPVLIQLIGGEADQASLAETRAAVVASVRELVTASGADPDAVGLQQMKRFVAADLTRLEIESLRSLYRQSRIDKVWRNATKRALINQSTQTVQARPANMTYGASGQGIGWAVLDSGIRADHPHFSKHRNITRQWDCTVVGEAVELAAGEPGFATLDANGHGTHVAGIIAGEMTIAAGPGLAEQNFAGMAPATRLYGFKVLKDDGQGQDAFIIKALDKIADINENAGELRIHGVNLSLGGAFDASVYGCGHTPLCQELRRLWHQGVLICLAAGNEGYALLQADAGPLGSNMDLSIGDPANLEEAIAVGSVHKTRPHTFGVSYFSSRGPTADGRRKPDVVAPGEQVLSAWHRAPANGQSASDLYIEMSGTSMATPHVSGVLAAFLSVRREFIGYPDKVKQILRAHCTDLERDPYIQGAGLPNLMKMLANT